MALNQTADTGAIELGRLIGFTPQRCTDGGIGSTELIALLHTLYEFLAQYVLFVPCREGKTPSSKGGSDRDRDADSTHSGGGRTSRHDYDETNIHPRKRKGLRQRQHVQQQEDSTGGATVSVPRQPAVHHEKPVNPYELFLDIRKKVGSVTTPVQGRLHFALWVHTLYLIFNYPCSQDQPCF